MLGSIVKCFEWPLVKKKKPSLNAVHLATTEIVFSGGEHCPQPPADSIECIVFH